MLFRSVSQSRYAGHDIDGKKSDTKGKSDKKEKDKGHDNEKGKGKKGISWILVAEVSHLLFRL